MASQPSLTAEPAPELATEPDGLISGRLLPIVAIVLAMSNFMVILDLTITNVSVPSIAGSLGVSTDESTWIITSYAVAEAICVPLTGWLALRFGSLRTFIVCLAGFGLFSFLCGTSTSLAQIVICRIGQGLCGGPIMPISQALMLRAFPIDKRNAALGLWVVTLLIGPALGPILGGWLTDTYSWHWIFLINIPVALGCIVGAYTLLQPAETPRVKVPIDRIGLGLLVFWIGCLQVMLDIGRNHDWFTDWRIVTLAGCSLTSFVTFVIWELTEEHPVVDLRVFRHFGYSVGVVTMALVYGAYFAGVVVIPQWLQIDQGYSAQQAGLITAYSALSAMAMAPIVSKLIGKIDTRLMVSGGAIWFGMTTLMRAYWTSDSDFWTLAMPQILQGFAFPFVLLPLTATTLGFLPSDKTASGAGLQNFLRTMAVAFATSIILTVWGNAQRVALTDIANRLQPSPTQHVLSGAGFDPQQIPYVIGNLVNREAMAVGINQTFVDCAVVLFIAAAVVWFMPTAKGTPPSPPLH